MSKTIDEELTEGNWAIVIGHGGKYIGQVSPYNGWNDDWASSDEEAIVKCLGKSPVVINFAQELIIQLIPSQSMVNGKPQMVFSRNIECIPFVRCLDTSAARVHMIPTDISFFRKMSAADRTYHEQLVINGYKNAERARAQAAGIILAGPDHPLHTTEGNA